MSLGQISFEFVHAVAATLLHPPDGGHQTTSDTPPWTLDRSTVSERMDSLSRTSFFFMTDRRLYRLTDYGFPKNRQGDATARQTSDFLLARRPWAIDSYQIPLSLEPRELDRRDVRLLTGADGLQDT